MAMVTGAPSPRKGALVALRLPDPIPQVIAFQYNPETMARTVEPGYTGGEGAPGEALRLSGPPAESIKLDVEIDAVDQLDAGSETAGQLGIHPQLALLELLIYPSSAVLIANTVLMALGTIEVIPPQGLFVLFIWGPQRVLPVKITEFSVTEEAYDHKLNPIRAKVSLGLKVLSTNDLTITHPGYHLFLAHHVTKEAISLVARASTLESIGSGNVNIL